MRTALLPERRPASLARAPRAPEPKRSMSTEPDAVVAPGYVYSVPCRVTAAPATWCAIAPYDRAPSRRRWSLPRRERVVRRDATRSWCQRARGRRAEQPRLCRGSSSSMPPPRDSFSLSRNRCGTAAAMSRRSYSSGELVRDRHQRVRALLLNPDVFRSPRLEHRGTRREIAPAANYRQFQRNLAPHNALHLSDPAEAIMNGSHRIPARLFLVAASAALTLSMPVVAQIPGTPGPAPASQQTAETVNLTMEQRHVIKEIIIKDMKIAPPQDQAAKVPTDVGAGCPGRRSASADAGRGVGQGAAAQGALVPGRATTRS